MESVWSAAILKKDRDESLGAVERLRGVGQ